MNKAILFRIIGAVVITAVLLFPSGCNKNNDEGSFGEGDTQGEQLTQSGAETNPNTAGNQSNATAGGTTDAAGTSSDADSFEEDDPDTPVSSDGNASSQPSGEQQEDGSSGEGAGSDGGSAGEGGSEDPNEGVAEPVPDEETPDSGSETVVYDEKLAQEYEDYLALSAEEQLAFHETFEDPSSFRKWRIAAQAAYDAKQAANTVTGGSLNLHDYVKGNS